MEIYPVHLRKLRSEQTKGSILEMESEKLKENLNVLFDDFYKLKKHLEYMENKYKIKGEEN
ncbi:TPA: hypothetical protein ACTZ2G_005400 [Bacillus cereus]|uniref:Uncharacterized protein n=1 Tax=Bacillus cereus TaxID=1396 RepID=A0A2A8PT65_BACCE|nr:MULTISPECIES: hypothetical protein [Bacillus]MDV8115027.1 hypothetical protein [Bacillus sp. BAU-SS-2023]CJC80197.1 Uncharacterised protein [Streptococcus pneumoniae]HDX9568653.1 hypothetical protein [Bacillus thuringiensis]MCC2460821.1 hypothetical protein [Bacillus mobilis]MCT4480901.1 hypothetical protein [Bacillus sp. DN_7.5]